MPQNIPILHIITRLIVGGAQENTMYTAAMLDKNLFNVEILSGPQTGSEGSLIEEVRSRNILLTIMPDLLREISPFHDFTAYHNLATFMKTKSFTIVHTHSSKAGILGRFAARRAGVPIIIHTIHGWSFHEHLTTLKKLLFILLERTTANFTDILIVVTKRDIDKGLFYKIGKMNQYHLIRSAIQLEEFDPRIYNKMAIRNILGIPDEATVIGNVGRFSSQKNPLDWVRVAGEIGRKDPNTFFLLVGDGPLRPQVENQLIREEIFNRTILTGLRRDVPNMLSAMDIFLLTSLWEGLPRVIPQSMAMEIPIVANSVDGITEAITDGATGFLCYPGDKNQLVERCMQLVNNSRLRTTMGKQCRDYALSEFDLGVMINKITNLYENLLAEKKINLANKLPL